MVHLKAGLWGAIVLICGTLSLPALAGHWRSSAVGANYGKLEQLLAESNWEAATAETKFLIFQISSRNHQPGIGQDWLTATGVENFPCRDLKTLDRLWRQHSNDRYGFSVQLRLWGEPLDPEAIQKDPKRWQRFRKHLGWQPREDEEFQPDIEGRLPEPIRSTLDFGDDAVRDESDAFYGAAWLRRAQQCELPPATVSQQALNWQAEQTANNPD
jgi:hypothetical protein